MPRTVSECFEAIKYELPYWMREVHGKHIVDRVEKFIRENETNRNELVAQKK